jgi:hypothetical protein
MKSLPSLAARLRSLLSGQRPVVAMAALRHDVIEPLSIPAFKRTGTDLTATSRKPAA